MAYILIVDDDEDFASAVAAVLKKAGHEVRVELEPGAGLLAMQVRQPDLAILDVMFPEDSAAGFELARTMRSSASKLRNVPILMLTAVNTKFPLGFGPKDIDDEWLPVSDFLEKPIDFNVLTQKVEALCKAGAARASK